MKSQIHLLRALVVVGAMLLLATGCNVANPFAPSNASAKQNGEELQLKWAQCMRQHGVNVSDPNANGAVRIQGVGSAGTGDTGGGAGGSGPDQGPPPDVQAAMDACRQYRPNGGQASGPANQQMVDATVKFAQCMRDHGIPMHDPKVQNGGIAVVASPGAFDPDSDQFKQAQQACQHYLPGGNGGGKIATQGGNG